MSPNGKLLARANEPRTRVALVSPSGPPQFLPGDARRNRVLRVSPDGTLIAFARTEGGSINVYEVDAGGSSEPRPVVTGPGVHWPAAWTQDGAIIYVALTQGQRMRIVAQGKDGAQRVLVEEGTASLGIPALSPDGRWLAYTSNQTQRTEVYVRAMNGEGKWLVSTHGGAQPVWSRDGATLYYLENGHLVAATLVAGHAFGVSERHAVADRFSVENVVGYDAVPGAKGLAVLVPTDEFAQIRVVVNWIDEVRIKMRR